MADKKSAEPNLQPYNDVQDLVEPHTTEQENLIDEKISIFPMFKHGMFFLI
jgi:hypothetical protein